VMLIEITVPSNILLLLRIVSQARAYARAAVEYEVLPNGRASDTAWSPAFRRPPKGGTPKLDRSGDRFVEDLQRDVNVVAIENQGR
jgi:hypothetical protein